MLKDKDPPGIQPLAEDPGKMTIMLMSEVLRTDYQLISLIWRKMIGL